MCALDGISWGASGRAFLEKGFTPRSVVTLLHSFQLLRPFVSEPSVPLCTRALPLSATAVAMATLVRPEHFQTEEALDVVHRLLGWIPPPTPRPDPWRPPRGLGQQTLPVGSRVRLDVLPEPRPGHLLGDGDCRSDDRHRRHCPGGCTRCCGCGGRALPAGSR
jgi:hypothetical protein